MVQNSIIPFRSKNTCPTVYQIMVESNIHWVGDKYYCQIFITFQESKNMLNKLENLSL